MGREPFAGPSIVMSPFRSQAFSPRTVREREEETNT